MMMSQMQQNGIPVGAQIPGQQPQQMAVDPSLGNGQINGTGSAQPGQNPNMMGMYMQNGYMNGMPMQGQMPMMNMGMQPG